MMGEDPGQDTTDNLHEDLVSSLAATGGCTSARTGLYLDYHELVHISELIMEDDETPEDVSILEKLLPVIEVSEVQHRVFQQSGTCVKDMGGKPDA